MVITYIILTCRSIKIKLQVNTIKNIDTQNILLYFTIFFHFKKHDSIFTIVSEKQLHDYSSGGAGQKL